MLTMLFLFSFFLPPPRSFANVTFELIERKKPAKFREVRFQKICKRFHTQGILFIVM